MNVYRLKTLKARAIKFVERVYYDCMQVNIIQEAGRSRRFCLYELLYIRYHKR